MNIPEEFIEMVDRDIIRISNAAELSSAEKLKLHRELDGRYQACIIGWYNGLWGMNDTATQINYNLIMNSDDSIQENLEMMKGKLDTFRCGMNIAPPSGMPSTQVNILQNVNVNLTFEQVREQIEDMTSLSREQADEIHERINELENISKEKTSRRVKWEKVKPIITFALDKGIDVAIAIMTLIIQMKLGC